MPGHGRDRSDRQTVIAAQEDRHTIRSELAVHRAVYLAIPGRHFGEVPIAAHRGASRVGRAAQVAAIAHIEASTGERRDQTRDTQRLRTHRGAAIARAHIGRCADQTRLRRCGAHATLPSNAGVLDLGLELPSLSSPNRSFGSSRLGMRSMTLPPASSRSSRCK